MNAVVRRQPCRDRILAALRLDAKTVAQLCYELFITRGTARLYLAELVREGLVVRKFFHDRMNNRPSYLYSTVKFPLRYPVAAAHSEAAKLLGDIDAIDWKQVKR